MNVKEKITKHLELAVFFFFLSTSLFFGDGKQPFVDAWWALGILMMYGVRYYRRGKLDLFPLPQPISLAWTALILYHIILIPFSDSAGYSITATIRLIEAYLIYVMFSTISSEQTTTAFLKELLVVGVVATAASFVFLLSPSLAGFLPPMNLLYTTYGHNHLADLLLFIFPIATTRPWLLLILFTVGTILTFARGAWVLLVVYLLFLARRAGLLAAAATVAAFLLISLGLTPIQKPSLLADGRWEYWRQAIEAIKERPLFGSGPGTFYLESKRLQSAPSFYSWFAHSFPLQITVESGVVGLVIFLFLLWNVFQKSKRSPLLWGAGLVLVYSLYEFSLDYTVIWLLVWAALGSQTTHDAKNLNKPKIVSGALIVLVLFYASSTSSLAASVLGYPKLAFFLAPHDAETAKDAPPRIAAIFHKANPEVYSALIDAVTEEDGKQKAKERLAILDPWNTLADDVAEYYVNKKDWDSAAKLLKKKQDNSSYTRKATVSKQMLRLGDGLYKEEKPTEAAEWYRRAQLLDAWILDKHLPIFLTHAEPIKKQLDFFRGLAATPGEYLGQHREAYSEAYLSALTNVIRSGDNVDISIHVVGIMQWTPWKRSVIWKDIGSLLIQQRSVYALLQAFSLWETLTPGGEQVDWNTQRKLSEALVTSATAVAPENLVLTVRAYRAATRLVSWALNEKGDWFVRYSPKDVSYSSLVSYINQEENTDELGTQNVTEALLFLVDKLITDGRPQEASRYAQRLRALPTVDYQRRKKVMIVAQKKADELLLTNRVKDAEVMVVALINILPEDYWTQAQPGYFYVAIGDSEKAKNSFSECLVARLGNHTDCSLGLQEVISGDLRRNRYKQISLIIQRMARWQDFIR